MAENGGIERIRRQRMRVNRRCGWNNHRGSVPDPHELSPADGNQRPRRESVHCDGPLRRDLVPERADPSRARHAIAPVEASVRPSHDGRGAAPGGGEPPRQHVGQLRGELRGGKD